MMSRGIRLRARKRKAIFLPAGGGGRGKAKRVPVLAVSCGQIKDVTCSLSRKRSRMHATKPNPIFHLHLWCPMFFFFDMDLFTSLVGDDAHHGCYSCRKSRNFTSLVLLEDVGMHRRVCASVSASRRERERSH